MNTITELVYQDFPNGIKETELAGYMGQQVSVKYYHYSHHSHHTEATGIVSLTDKNTVFVDNGGEGVFADEIRKFCLFP